MVCLATYLVAVSCNSCVCVCACECIWLCACVSVSDIDECAGAVSPCHALADCRNTLRGFVCTCRDGYTGSGLDCTGAPAFTSDTLLNS